MICDPCKLGGLLLAQHAPRNTIEAAHENCPGGTWCPCAHDTVSMLNSERIREQEQPVRGVVE